jgi:DNA-binding transcriptional LysR family regulator
MIVVELRHLRYFPAVAEEQSFTRAAARLYVSQPTLSQQIRALEKIIGYPLFHRDPGGMRLTPAGQALMEPTRSALIAVADGIQAARDAARPDNTILRVGLSYAAASALTHEILHSFARTFPQAQLVFRELATGVLHSELLSGEIDVGFTWLPLDPDRHAWTILVEESLILGVNSRHPLADADAVSLEDALALPMAFFDPGRTPLDVIAFWQLHEQRNGEPPEQPTSPVATVGEIAHAIMENPSVVAVGIELMRKFPPLPGPSLHFLDLLGAGTNQAVAARRRNDRRALVLAFCQIAGVVARQLATWSSVGATHQARVARRMP